MEALDEERAAAREILCRLLAACYYEPGPEFREERVFDTICKAAGLLHPDLAARATRLDEAYRREEGEALLVDYTRLFVGPNGLVASPYGSVWLEDGGEVMGASTAAVATLYEEGGFEVAEDLRELPDHVAVELEFLYLLLHEENAARANGDAEREAAARALRARFLEDHLGRWIAPFAGAVAAGAQCAFYRELAALTDRFVRLSAQS